MSDRASEITEGCLAAIRRSTTAEELAAALKAWAEEASVAAGQTPEWWVNELRHLVNGGTFDEAPGITIDELIPEAVAEWKRIRDSVVHRGADHE